MTVNHRAEAEEHLDNAARHLTEHPGDMRIAEVAAAIGQGYATLARSEQTTTTAADLNEALQSLRRRFNDTRTHVSKYVAESLASRQMDRWKAAIDLTKALDEAHCNMDDLVDAHLSDNGWDPRSAYKVPAGEPGWIGFAAEKNTERDPWALAPDVTAQIPEPVRRVLAGHLAEMLLDPKADEVQKWARGITFELKREGLDLGDAIKKRITDLTLGADPSDPPF
ncbi:hypothetical protein [Streptomyces rubiginosohelvolus]|uniref:hypothetical protein n=1 Tax=Streptomyces rubiginosohelvolus TaxID=67362 RepID=UPI0036AD9798